MRNKNLFIIIIIIYFAQHRPIIVNDSLLVVIIYVKTVFMFSSFLKQHGDLFPGLPK